jgi:ABC-type glycerol-3-phosphate transport system substrate-binding protein
LAVFRSGQAAFFHTGSWFAAGLLDEPTEFETGMVPFPRAAHDQHPGDIIGAVTHVIGVSADAPRPEGAMEFLEYLIGESATEVWAGNGLFSLVDGAFEQHGPDQVKPLWEAVLQAEDSLAWVENELPPGVGEDRVYNGTTEIVAGRMSAEEFAESVQSALDAAR